MKSIFEKAAVQVCDCGAQHPHVYFYADTESEKGRLNIPFISVQAVDIFLDSQIVGGFITLEQKETMMKVAKEAGLREKMNEMEKLIMIPMAMALIVAFTE